MGIGVGVGAGGGGGSGVGVGVGASGGTGVGPDAGVGVVFVDGIAPAVDVGREVGVQPGVAVACGCPLEGSADGVYWMPEKEEMPGPVAFACGTPGKIASGILATSQDSPEASSGSPPG